MFKTKYITLKNGKYILLLLLGDVYTYTDLHSKPFVQVTPGVALELCSSSTSKIWDAFQLRHHDVNSNVSRTSTSLQTQKELEGVRQVSVAAASRCTNLFPPADRRTNQRSKNAKEKEALISTSMMTRNTTAKHTKQWGRNLQLIRQLFPLSGSQF